MFDEIFEFEKQLSHFTGAPYVIVTDCCTHALELCFIYTNVIKTKFTPYTYLSIPMMLHKIGVEYNLLNERSQEWKGEYKFENTNIWDSARRFERSMFRTGQLQCLSFGHNKPLQIGRGGAILTDSPTAYKDLKEMSYDGRDLNISPWEKQKVFKLGYHYKPTIEEAVKGIELIKTAKEQNQFVQYPDLREIEII